MAVGIRTVQGNRYLVHTEAPTLQRKIRFRHQDSLARDAINGFTVWHRNTLDIFHRHAQHREVRFHVLREGFEDQQLLIGAGSGHPIVIDFRVQRIADALRKSLMIVTAIAGRIGIPEEEYAPTARLGSDKFDIGTESERISLDQVAAQFVRDAGGDIGDIGTSNTRVVLNDHPVCGLTQQHHDGHSVTAESNGQIRQIGRIRDLDPSGSPNRKGPILNAISDSERRRALGAQPRLNHSLPDSGIAGDGPHDSLGPDPLMAPGQQPQAQGKLLGIHTMNHHGIQA